MEDLDAFGSIRIEARRAIIQTLKQPVVEDDETLDETDDATLPKAIVNPDILACDDLDLISE
jgi:hypothetical protein